jgi:triosephosphate isomerase
MNHTRAETRAYAKKLRAKLRATDCRAIDLFVLPPFTSLAAAEAGFARSPVGIGGQNMHWAEAGAWTGEISGAMLADAGCRYVELAHSERLQYFGETYGQVRLKVNAALASGLMPILCLGESAGEKRAGKSDPVLTHQIETALADIPATALSRVVLAYEPRWAIGASRAAPVDYVEARHRHLRAVLAQRWGRRAANATRIIYGGSVSAENGPELIRQTNVDGLFVGRSAWTPQGFAQIVQIVAEAAATKEKST